MSKTTTCVTIDPHLKSMIRKMGGNISEILDNCLKAYIEQEEEETPRIVIENQINEISKEQKKLSEKKAILINRLDTIYKKQEKQEQEDYDDKLKMANAIKNTDVIRRG